MTPSVVVDLAAVEHNTRAVVELCRSHGIEVMGVTKAVFGDPDVAAAMIRGGVTALGDSRLESLARLRAAGTRVPLVLLRPPSVSEVGAMLDIADSSMQTELVTLERIGDAARVRGRPHDIVVMVDLGDRREGVLPEMVTRFVVAARRIPGIRLVGLAANLGCLHGLEPTIEDMIRLVDCSREIERATGQELSVVSGGSSNVLPLVAGGALPPRIGQVRIGEAILLGREPTHHRPWPGTTPDVFELRAEILELKDKPPPPRRPRADTAFVRAPPPALGGGRRALVAVGRADVDVDGLEPVERWFEVVGATSDYVVLDVAGAAGDVRVGDEIGFRMDYGALVTAMGAGRVGVRPLRRTVESEVG